MLEREKLLEIYRDLFLTQIYEALRGLSEKGLWTFYHGIIGEEVIVHFITFLRDLETEWRALVVHVWQTYARMNTYTIKII